MNYIFKNT